MRMVQKNKRKMSAPDTRGSGAQTSYVETFSEVHLLSITSELVILSKKTSDLEESLIEKEHAARYITDILNSNVSDKTLGDCSELLLKISTDVGATRMEVTRLR